MVPDIAAAGSGGGSGHFRMAVPIPCKVFTGNDGWVWIFSAVDHWNAECMGSHVCKYGTRFAALEPISQGIMAIAGSVGPDAGRGLALRMDHGTQYLSDHFLKQIKEWGVNPSFAFVEQPQTALCRELDSMDWTTLSGLGLGRVIDLRTPGEISATPDVVPAGAVYTNINVIGTSNIPTMIPASATLASLLSVGQSGYQTFVTDPVEREGFRTVLLTLAHDPGPDLFHCSMGKDRTGWTAALLESIAGVSSTTLMNDYLASNTYLAGTIEAQAAALAAAVPELRGADLTPLFGVNSGYLQAALDQVTTSYGSMYGYLMQGLALVWKTSMCRVGKWSIIPFCPDKPFIPAMMRLEQPF